MRYKDSLSSRSDMLIGPKSCRAHMFRRCNPRGGEKCGLTRSRDGVTGWQRHPANPIVFPVAVAWDADACYKPFAIFDRPSDRWLLWYNGRQGNVEQIGLVTHIGYDLGFPAP